MLTSLLRRLALSMVAIFVITVGSGYAQEGAVFGKVASSRHATSADGTNAQRRYSVRAAHRTPATSYFPMILRCGDAEAIDARKRNAGSVQRKTLWRQVFGKPTRAAGGESSLRTLEPSAGSTVVPRASGAAR
jgi:hypothetical protein